VRALQLIRILIDQIPTPGKCLTAASNNDGAWVTIQPCNGSPSQKWTFTGGMVQVFGNKCLDVTDGRNVDDGTRMQIWTCWGQNPNQQWYYDKVFRKSFIIRNIFPELF